MEPLDLASSADPQNAPPVLAVLVTHADAAEVGGGASDRLTTSLRALAAQDYPQMGVVVVDAGSPEDPTAAVRAVLPEASVHRVEEDDGFGAAANIVLADDSHEIRFLLFCHDDAAPAPDAIRRMVDAALRWNAGVVGPKLVRWDDPRRLSQVGMAVARTGVALPMVEPGELDQGQQDAVREVFAVPGAFTLVRADLFRRIGGFDESISFLADDLSLCWRARIAGARVVLEPAASVRHRAALSERLPPDVRRRYLARHRLRVVLTSYSGGHLLRVVPQVMLATLLDATLALLTLRPSQARIALGAWWWNLRRPRGLRDARRHVRSFRRVDDGIVRQLHVPGVVRPHLALHRAERAVAPEPPPSPAITAELPELSSGSTAELPELSSGSTAELPELPDLPEQPASLPAVTADLSDLSGLREEPASLPAVTAEFPELSEPPQRSAPKPRFEFDALGASGASGASGAPDATEVAAGWPDDTTLAGDEVVAAVAAPAGVSDDPLPAGAAGTGELETGAGTGDGLDAAEVPVPPAGRGTAGSPAEGDDSTPTNPARSPEGDGRLGDGDPRPAHGTAPGSGGTVGIRLVTDVSTPAEVAERAGPDKGGGAASDVLRPADAPGPQRRGWADDPLDGPEPPEAAATASSDRGEAPAGFDRGRAAGHAGQAGPVGEVVTGDRDVAGAVTAAAGSAGRGGEPVRSGRDEPSPDAAGENAAPPVVGALAERAATAGAAGTSVGAGRIAPGPGASGTDARGTGAGGSGTSEGGASTPGGQRAAASHTGSLAPDARVFDGTSGRATSDVDGRAGGGHRTETVVGTARVAGAFVLADPSAPTVFGVGGADRRSPTPVRPTTSVAAGARPSGHRDGGPVVGRAPGRPAAAPEATVAPASRMADRIESLRTGWTSGGVVVTLTLVALLLTGSRHLLTRGVPEVGELTAFGDPAGLLDEWRSGWRQAGWVSDTPVPTLLGVLGGVGTLVSDHLGLLRTLLTVGLIPLGIVGAFRLLRPGGSARAPVATAVAYAAIPLPYAALAHGRWAPLAAYAAAPWLLAQLARATGAAPFAASPPGLADGHRDPTATATATATNGRASIGSDQATAAQATPPAQVAGSPAPGLAQGVPEGDARPGRVGAELADERAAGPTPRTQTNGPAGEAADGASEPTQGGDSAAPAADALESDHQVTDPLPGGSDDAIVGGRSAVGDNTADVSTHQVSAAPAHGSDEAIADGRASASDDSADVPAHRASGAADEASAAIGNGRSGLPGAAADVSAHGPGAVQAGGGIEPSSDGALHLPERASDATASRVSGAPGGGFEGTAGADSGVSGRASDATAVRVSGAVGGGNGSSDGDGSGELVGAAHVSRHRDVEGGAGGSGPTHGVEAGGVAQSAVSLGDGIARGLPYDVKRHVEGSSGGEGRVPRGGSRGGVRGDVGAGVRAVRVGIVVALLAMVVPVAPALVVVLALVLGVGSVLAFEPRGVIRSVSVAIGGAVVAVALHLPWTVDVVRSWWAAEQQPQPATVATVIGPWLGFDGATAGRADLVGGIVGFGGTTSGPAGLWWALPAAAGLVLLVGRSWRLAWGIRGWALALAGWAGAWAVGWVVDQNAFQGPLPHPDVLLALTAPGLALAVGMGIAAIEHDVAGRSRRLGFRRLATALGSLALVAAVLPLVRASVDGWWGMPRGEFAGLLDFVEEEAAESSARVLWVGDATLLPAPGWTLDAGDAVGDGQPLTYAVSRGLPETTDLWPGPVERPARHMGTTLRQALDRQTSRLGHLLAPLGIEYVVVPQGLAPTDVGDDVQPAPARLAAALAGQLDLERVDVDAALLLYRNTAAVPGWAVPLVGDLHAAGAPPVSRTVLLGAQGGLWLIALVVALRPRRQADRRSRPGSLHRDQRARLTSRPQPDQLAEAPPAAAAPLSRRQRRRLRRVEAAAAAEVPLSRRQRRRLRTDAAGATAVHLSRRERRRLRRAGAAESQEAADLSRRQRRRLRRVEAPEAVDDPATGASRRERRRLRRAELASSGDASLWRRQRRRLGRTGASQDADVPRSGSRRGRRLLRRRQGADLSESGGVIPDSDDAGDDREGEAEGKTGSPGATTADGNRDDAGSNEAVEPPTDEPTVEDDAAPPGTHADGTVTDSDDPRVLSTRSTP